MPDPLTYSDPLEILLAWYDAETLRDAFQSLSQRDRLILGLRFGYDRPASVVARIVGVSPECIGTRVYRAKGRIRKYLQEHDVIIC